MKKYFIAAVFIMAFCAKAWSENSIKAHTLDNKILADCQSKHGVTDQEANQFVENPAEASEKVKCMVLCYLQEEFVLDAAGVPINQPLNAGDKVTNAKLPRCYAIRDDNPCEAAYLFLNCIIGVYPDILEE